MFDRPEGRETGPREDHGRTWDHVHEDEHEDEDHGTRGRDTKTDAGSRDEDHGDAVHEHEDG